MTPLFRKFLGMNWVLVLTMFCLLVFGVFAIHGASWVSGEAGSPVRLAEKPAQLPPSHN